MNSNLALLSIRPSRVSPAGHHPVDPIHRIVYLIPSQLTFFSSSLSFLHLMLQVWTQLNIIPIARNQIPRISTLCCSTPFSTHSAWSLGRKKQPPPEITPSQQAAQLAHLRDVIKGTDPSQSLKSQLQRTLYIPKPRRHFQRKTFSTRNSYSVLPNKSSKKVHLSPSFGKTSTDPPLGADLQDRSHPLDTTQNQNSDNQELSPLVPSPGLIHFYSPTPTVAATTATRARLQRTQERKEKQRRLLRARSAIANMPTQERIGELLRSNEFLSPYFFPDRKFLNGRILPSHGSASRQVVA